MNFLAHDDAVSVVAYWKNGDQERHEDASKFASRNLERDAPRTAWSKMLQPQEEADFHSPAIQDLLIRGLSRDGENAATCGCRRTFISLLPEVEAAGATECHHELGEFEHRIDVARHDCAQRGKACERDGVVFMIF